MVIKVFTMSVVACEDPAIARQLCRYMVMLTPCCANTAAISFINLIQILGSMEKPKGRVSELLCRVSRNFWKQVYGNMLVNTLKVQQYRWSQNWATVTMRNSPAIMNLLRVLRSTTKQSSGELYFGMVNG